MNVASPRSTSRRLLAASGWQNKPIAKALGVGRVQLARWQERYVQGGIEAVERDLPRGAPPLKLDGRRSVELTVLSTPEAAATGGKPVGQHGRRGARAHPRGPRGKAA